jgi:hypothetical protein
MRVPLSGYNPLGEEISMTIAEFILVALGIGQFVYAALAFHWDRAAMMKSELSQHPRRPLVIVGMFMVLTWAAVAFNFYNKPAGPDAVIASYGIDVIPVEGMNQFHSIVQLSDWMKWQN